MPDTASPSPLPLGLQVTLTAEIVERTERIGHPTRYELTFSGALGDDDVAHVDHWWHDDLVKALVVQIPVAQPQPTPAATASDQAATGQPDDWADVTDDAAGSALPIALPRIGTYRREWGGYFAGIGAGQEPGECDYLLIASESAPDAPLSWHAASMWAQHLSDGGHINWRLPTRAEAWLLHVNAPHLLAMRRIWLHEADADGPRTALSDAYRLVHDAGNAPHQPAYRSGDEFSAVAVRRIPLRHC